MPKSEGLDMGPWYAEKLSSVVEELARAIAAHRLVEDEAIRDVVGRSLHVALHNAMKLAAIKDDDPSLFSPARMEAIWNDPNLVRAWLEDIECPLRSEENVTDSARRQVNDLRRWIAGERPPGFKG
jgi:hypothetical protein